MGLYKLTDGKTTNYVFILEASWSLQQSAMVSGQGIILSKFILYNLQQGQQGENHLNGNTDHRAKE